MRLIDADRLLFFIEFDAEVISPEKHTAKDIVMMIKTAPTLDPVKHAYWEHHGKGYNFALICSECGCCSHTGFDYCPECGARMDGDSE